MSSKNSIYLVCCTYVQPGENKSLKEVSFTHGIVFVKFRFRVRGFGGRCARISAKEFV